MPIANTIIRARTAGKSTRRPIATSWRSFEKLARIACEKLVEPLRIPSVGGKFIGGGKMIKQKSACDFCGTVRATGRAFVVDFKTCDHPSSFYFSTHLKDHQRRELLAHGEAGAIAGIILEVTSTPSRGVYFCRWEFLKEPFTHVGFHQMKNLGSGVDVQRVLQLVG